MSDASIGKAQILVVCLTERTVVAVQTPRIAFGRLRYRSLQWRGNEFSTGWSRPTFSRWGSGALQGPSGVRGRAPEASGF